MILITAVDRPGKKDIHLPSCVRRSMIPGPVKRTIHAWIGLTPREVWSIIAPVRSTRNSSGRHHLARPGEGCGGWCYIAKPTAARRRLEDEYVRLAPGEDGCVCGGERYLGGFEPARPVFHSIHPRNSGWARENLGQRAKRGNGPREPSPTLNHFVADGRTS